MEGQGPFQGRKLRPRDSGLRNSTVEEVERAFEDEFDGILAVSGPFHRSRGTAKC